MRDAFDTIRYLTTMARRGGAAGRLPPAGTVHWWTDKWQAEWLRRADAGVTGTGLPGPLAMHVEDFYEALAGVQLDADPPGQNRRSGHLPASVAEMGDDIDASAERGDVGADDVDAGDLPVLDLGDAGLGHAQGVGQFCLG
jgi:hypothetical protein